MLAKIVNWLRDLWCRFFWPREAISNIQLDVVTILAETRMQHEMTMTKLNRLGAQMSAATEVLDRIDSRTNDVANLVRSLRDELANTSDASPEVLARLGAVADALDAVAANPSDPTPPVDDPDVPDQPPVDNGGDNIPPLG